MMTAHPSGLHLHSFGWQDGHLGIELATGTGRHMHMELDPDDHPHLLGIFQQFVAACLTAAETTMLDIVGLRGSAPDNPAELTRIVPCYLCGFPVTTEEPAGVKVYCADHHGTGG